MKKISYLLIPVIFWGCNYSTETEKYQNKRDNIFHVQEKVKEINTEDVLISSLARLYIVHDYLIISDHHSTDKLIYIFDRNNFHYIGNAVDRGQGPGEIANMGHIAASEDGRFYITDHGKQKIFSYNIDSVIANPLYMPDVKMTLNVELFPDKYQYINDTLSMGLVIKPIGNSDYKPYVAKWNMNTGHIELMKYEHPGIDNKKRIGFAMSLENNIYIEYHYYHDLMTICSLDGDLKCNIYGPSWNIPKVYNYRKVVFCGNRILASYSGERNFQVRFPTKFLVFNMEGDYIQTLETGYNISDFCYDKDNNRIIMSLDAEVQFAYLDLDGLVE
ncbi:MAG: 6-bladed beta-propeller [Prevotellaceae bacterium]|jgi:hypothetical protein|nr:6-bladed beta-propeller [Prevotellaceae bacterium]